MPQRPYRPVAGRRIILIQCEGKRTEYLYLEGLCTQCGLRRHAAIDVNPGTGHNATVTVQTAIDKIRAENTRGKRYDEVMCVLDVEHAAHADNLTQAITLARKHNITLYLSHPSFEVWLLCHFGHVTSPLENGDAAVRRLNEAFRQNDVGCDYDKADPKLYTHLASRLPAAIDNAQWLLEIHQGNLLCRDANPSTEVYKLINVLLPQPPAPRFRP